ncbi:hypothetical protein Hanom_Chr03g00187951 [Helianthus anomalus]
MYGMILISFGKFDGPLEYHRATSGITRSYLYPLGIMPIHQFRRKHNKYEKNPLVRIEPRISSKSIRRSLIDLEEI